MGSEHVLTCSRVKRGTSHSLKSGREIVTKCSWLKSGGVHMLLSVEKGQCRKDPGQEPMPSPMLCPKQP